MNNTLQAVYHNYGQLCFGDFNFPSIYWSGKENTPNLGSCSSVSLKNIMSKFAHSHINDVISNYAGNIFDLILTKDSRNYIYCFCIFSVYFPLITLC